LTTVTPTRSASSGEGHATLLEEPVQVDGDAVVGVLGGISDRAFDVLTQAHAMADRDEQQQQRAEIVGDP
jgi:hypothetical protein